MFYSKESYDLVKALNETIHSSQSLYLYRVFASYIMNVKKEKCSICGKERLFRNLCGHRVGKLYNGELCCNEVIMAEPVGVDYYFFSSA